MRVRRVVRSVSTFLTQFFGALLKAAITGVVLAVLVVSIMHYMGVPVPSATDLFGGFSQLTHIFS